MASVVESSIFQLEDRGYRLLYWSVNRGKVEVILSAANVDTKLTHLIQNIKKSISANRVDIETSREFGTLLVKVVFYFKNFPKDVRPRGFNDLLAWGLANLPSSNS